MIEFDEFYRTVGDLRVEQEVRVYPVGDKHPRAIFRKCKYFDKFFVLVYNTLSGWFSIVQDTEQMSFSASLRGFFEDLADVPGGFRMEVENRKFFPVSNVSREDLQELGFDTSGVDDETMEQLATKLDWDYCEQMFWISLEIIAEDGLKIPREDDEC